MARTKSNGTKDSTAAIGFEATLRLPRELFYSTQIPACLWFVLKQWKLVC